MRSVCGEDWSILKNVRQVALYGCANERAMQLPGCQRIFPVMLRPGCWTKETKPKGVFLTSQTMNRVRRLIRKQGTANSTNHAL